MPASEAVILRHEPCPWLPEGGVAEVVLAVGSTMPEPAAVVRLLVTADDAVLAMPRPDGRGLDIPTVVVAGDIGSAVRGLHSRVLGGRSTPRLLGFVRNTVSEAADDYPWPVPTAHFVVWHTAVGAEQARQGQWLGGGDAQRHLGERHWWPLFAHARSSERA